MFVLTALVGCGKEAPRAAAGPVRRVVTATPSATDLMIACGAADRIVAVDRYSDQPEVAKLPRVGDFLSPDLEAIVGLSPDLVVLDELQTKTVEALRAGGVRTMVLPMHTIEHVRSGLDALGEALGTAAACKQVGEAIDRELAAVAARTRARTGPAPRGLLIVDRELGGLGSMVAAGPGSFLDELARAIGVDNVLAISRARYPKISPEQVIEAKPAVILDAVHTPDAARARRDWDRLEVPAVASGDVFILDDRIFISPGPRVGEALTRLEKLVYE